MTKILKIQNNILKYATKVLVLPSKFVLNTVEADADGSYDPGTIVVIQPTIPEGKYFVNWTGDISYITTGTVNTSNISITMPNVNITLIANLGNYVSLTVNNGTILNFAPVNYGALYNSYAAYDVRNITAAGWHIPIQVYTPVVNTEVSTLSAFISNNTGKLREIGTTYWNSPNTGATNELKFNARGGGYRMDTGGFSALKSSATFVYTGSITTTYYNFGITYNSNSFAYGNGILRTGLSIRLIKDSTTLTNGQSGIYIGNDGKIYPTICIGTQEWLATNLLETKYRNGDWIHGYDGGTYTPISNATWGSLTTEAMCFYNDSTNNS